MKSPLSKAAKETWTVNNKGSNTDKLIFLTREPSAHPKNLVEGLQHSTDQSNV